MSDTKMSAREQWKRQNPNLKVNGWDERDYRLWSEIRCLPSYGLIANDADNPMISRQDVIRLLETAAEKRFDENWAASLTPSEPTLHDFLQTVGRELGRRTNLLDHALAEIKEVAEYELAANSRTVDSLDSVEVQEQQRATDEGTDRSGSQVARQSQPVASEPQREEVDYEKEAALVIAAYMNCPYPDSVVLDKDRSERVIAWLKSRDAKGE